MKNYIIFILLLSFSFLSGISLYGQTGKPLNEYYFHKYNGGLTGFFNRFDDVRLTTEIFQLSDGTLLRMHNTDCHNPGSIKCRKSHSTVVPDNLINRFSLENLNFIETNVNQLVEHSENEANDGNTIGRKSKTIAISNNNEITYYVLICNWVYTDENATDGEIIVKLYELNTI